MTIEHFERVLAEEEKCCCMLGLSPCLSVGELVGRYEDSPAEKRAALRGWKEKTLMQEA